MSGGEGASAPQKRWDQFGRYTLDMQAEPLHREIDPVARLISFGDGRRLCLPSSGLTLSLLNGEGFLALAADQDRGLHSPLDSEAARRLARALIAMADRLDAAS